MGVRSVARGYSNGEHHSDGGTNRAANTVIYTEQTKQYHTFAWRYANAGAIKHNDNDNNLYQYCDDEPFSFSDSGALYYSYATTYLN